MTPALVVVALVVTGGAVAAVSAREPRLATLGLLVALLGAPFVADPLPGTIAVAARLVGTVLGAYVVWVSLRAAPGPTVGSRIGWPGAAAIAMAAFAAGWLSATTIGAGLASISGDGPSSGAAAASLVAGSPVARAALGASFALVALAAGPVLVARDVLRLGLGLLLLIAAVELLGEALGGRADDPYELALGILYAGGGLAVAGLVLRSFRVHGDLALRGTSSREVAVRTRGADEAHPAGRRR